MNGYNIMLLASTFTCGLLYAAEAPKDVVEHEAKKVAATLQVPPSPTRPITLKTPESPKRPSSWTCTVCAGFDPRAAGHVRTSSVSSDDRRPYWADFPGAGYQSR